MLHFYDAAGIIDNDAERAERLQSVGESWCVPFLITDWSRMLVPLASSMVC